VEYCILLLAFLGSDVALVPLNPHCNESKLTYLIAHSEADLIISSREWIKNNTWLRAMSCAVLAVEDILERASAPCSSSLSSSFPSDDREALILYTSGTVGDPKGIVLSRKAIFFKIHVLIKRLAFTKGERFFSFLPFFSGHGMLPGLLVPLLSGCKIYIDTFSPFLAPSFWQIVKDEAINHCTTVPSVLALLKLACTSPVDVKNMALKNIFCASSPLSQNLFDWVYATLHIRVRNCYGLSETASWIAISDGRDVTDSSYVGEPCGATFIVLNEKGERLPAHEVGELAVKTDALFSDYLKRSDLYTGEMRGDFFKTGDIGYLDDDGGVFLLDRAKNIIKRNGVTIYPAEIDEVLERFPSVAHACTFSIPDELLNERVVSALVTRGACDFKELELFMRQNLSGYLLPNDIFQCSHFPMGATGKIDLKALRRIYSEREGR
jgi:long-chain acyl-CoA synthetase